MTSHRSSSKKRKSSKRKSSKVTSEDRHKKRSKKTKSRKPRHSDESSYSSDASVSVSTSSSEDEYSRSRSHTRSKVKGKRKRSERSSSKHRISKKKKKGSRRNVDSDERRKSRKKKGRRELSVSSVSRDSRDGGNSKESELALHGGRSRGKGEGDGDMGKLKTGVSREERGRSRGKGDGDGDMGKLKTGVCREESIPVSCSPDGRYSRTDDLNSSRRLRSVIAVVKRQEVEAEEEDKGVHDKEEIAYDHNESPPSKSNDSYDYVRKGEISHHSQVDLESRRVEHHPIGEETLESKPNDREEMFHSAGGYSSTEEKKEDMFHPVSSSTTDDLETILRLKALENLKKYRGAVKKPNPPVDTENNNASVVKQLPSASIEFASNKSSDMNVSGVAGDTRLPDENLSSVRRINSGLPDEKVKATLQENVNHLTGHESIISDNSKESDRPPSSKPEISSLTSRRKLSSTHEDNKLVTESTAGKDAPESPLRVGQTSDKINSGGVNDLISEPPLEEQSPKEEPPCEENKEDSQFQQKTMSVMRGSETVQVSYKVYIPKKTPALARRLLRR